MIERYTLPEMKAIWSAENKFRKWLDVEIYACEAMAALNLIPREAFEQIKERARFDVKRIEEIEAVVNHDVIAFLTCVGEYVGEAARYIHLGLTSSDVMDTALASLAAEAFDHVIGGTRSLRETLAREAVEWRHAPMMGRTHGVHAEPITFGVKVALWHVELGRAVRRLQAAREAVRVGKLSGEVGTFAHLPPEIEAEVCARLGLEPDPVSSQVVSRDRHAEYLAALAVLAGTIEKIATEIRSLQRTEIRELEEPFAPGQTGSSAMPHKRNPILCERLVGLARTIRAAAQVAFENQALWGERDISHSSAERLILPQATTLAHYMLRTLQRVLDGLRVDAEAMRRNLERGGGLVFSHRVLLALVDKGLARDEAYRIVQDAAMAALDGRGAFRDLLAATGALSAAELDACFDLAPYLRHVDAILERAGIPRVPAPSGSAP